MYLLKEGSHSTNTPHFISLPENDPNPKANQLLFFPEIGVAKWFYESGYAEKPLIHWIYDTFITPDRNFVDIGAHIGTYSWTCGKKALHTYAFECSPITFCYLAANIALQGLEEKISPYPYALGNEEKTMDYYVRSKDGGGNGIKPLSNSDASCKKLQIPVKTLDSFHLTNIGCIKIDVEGFEKEVIMGALTTLQESQYPPIIFESWGSWKERDGVPANDIRKDLFQYIESIGYSIMPLSGAQDMYLAKKK
jgi:FkbM family methyltransferase